MRRRSRLHARAADRRERPGPATPPKDDLALPSGVPEQATGPAAARRARVINDWLKALRRGHVKHGGALLRAAEQVPERHAGADGQHRARADRGQDVAAVRRGGDRDGRRRRVHDRQVQAHRARRAATAARGVGGDGARRRSASSGARSRSGTACPTSRGDQQAPYGDRPPGVSVVAALYDVHGNLPALEAVLADAAFARADAVVVGGDVASGPMPAEVLDRLAALDLPAALGARQRRPRGGRLLRSRRHRSLRPSGWTIPRRGPMPPRPRASPLRIATCWPASRTSSRSTARCTATARRGATTRSSPR